MNAGQLPSKDSIRQRTIRRGSTPQPRGCEVKSGRSRGRHEHPGGRMSPTHQQRFPDKQYLLTMQYLARMREDQTLHMYSGHPLGLFPASADAPRVVITNGMMIPNHSSHDDWERYNALGVTQYGQMTAGSYMYIGPQGIVHGTTITILNAARRIAPDGDLRGKVFVSSGLGGMSGAQPKAARIAGCIAVVPPVEMHCHSRRNTYPLRRACSPPKRVSSAMLLPSR